MIPGPFDLLDRLQRACASGGARPARDADSVDGVRAKLVAYPSSTAEVSAVVSLCAETSSTLVARGSATKLDWGAAPSSVDVVVDLSGCAGVVEHEPGDFVVSVRAGTTLAALDSRLQASGQMLPVDEVVEGSSVGGIVATGLCGPSRFLHGAVRDLLIGVTVVRADGAVARSGSKVVKNVAGYDLPKLFTGSYGTLGIVTEAIFRLRPRPRSRRYLLARFAEEAELATALAGVCDSQLAFSAVEVERCSARAPISLGLLLEGNETTLARRVEMARDLLATSASRSRLEILGNAPSGWGALPGPVTLKVSIPIALLPELLAHLADLEQRFATPLCVRGSAGAGVLFLGARADVGEEALAACLEMVRSRYGPLGASVILLRAPTWLKAAVDGWGLVPGIELMRAIKARFDPERLLSPGRFVGGI